MSNFNYPMRGTVVTTVHPQGLMMARVRINGLGENLSEDSLPWAERNLPDGGAYSPLIAGGLVWVDFPYSGGSRHPRIAGFAQDAAGGTSNVAAEASGQGDPYSQKDVEGAQASPVLSATKDFVYKRNGLMEIRSSGGGWSMTHTAVGSTMGQNDDGEQYLIAQADIVINLTAKVTIKAAAEMQIVASASLKIEVVGDLVLSAAGTASFTAAQFKFAQG